MADAAFAPAKLLAILSEEGVDYVLVGALAVGVHHEIRNTGDVDIMVPTGDEENKRCLDRALKKLRASRVAEPAGADALAAAEYPTVMLRTRYGRLDVLYQPDGSPPYQQVARRSSTTTIAGQSVKVVGKDDLIAMKLAAGRDQDLRDVAALTGERDAKRIFVTYALRTGAAHDWVVDYASERVGYADPDGRAWVDDDSLKVEATLSGLNHAQARQWATALGDRLDAMEMLAVPEPDAVEIGDSPSR